MTTEQIHEAAEGTNSQRPSATDKRISLRFKASEWAIIAGDIQVADVSINAYFRQLALESPVPRKARKRPGAESAKIYAQFLGQLGKIGSNLNQLARQANVAMRLRDPTLMPSYEAIIAVLEEYAALTKALRQELKKQSKGKGDHQHDY